MEADKRAGCSSTRSSLGSDLFGSKDSSFSSSSGIFGSIFASKSPNQLMQTECSISAPRLSLGMRTADKQILFSLSHVVGRESLGTRAVEKKQDSASHAWNSKPGHPDSVHQNKQGESPSTWKDPNNSYYSEQKVQPCHLSSSIYYGGQDIYTTSYNSQSYEYSTFNKDQGEDDSGSASRGNWWQGGLYY